MYKMHTALALAGLLALSSASLAAAPATIKVSLQGEADQPMSVKLEHSKLKAGTYVLDVTNDAAVTDHEVVLVKLKSTDQKIAVDAKKHRIDESKLMSLGEVGGLKPGDHGSLKVKLAAGEYMLLCNHKSHFELGMATHLTVTN